jgi:hypothetical protein
MIILHDFEIIKVNGIDCKFYNSIYNRGNCWFLPFCHGYEDGNLTIDTPEGEFIMRPQDYRGVIRNSFLVDIPDFDNIYIAPCYGKKVSALQGTDLLKRGIIILSDEMEEEVVCVFTNEQNKMCYNEDDIVDGDIMTIAIEGKSKLPENEDDARMGFYNTIWGEQGS